MNSASCIEQKGVIENINNGLANVNISTFSSCANCHSKSACGISTSSSRIIQVPVTADTYSVGELVQVRMRKELGMRAALLAYVLPFLLVLILLLTLTSIQIAELFAGLISLFFLVPYFFGLYLFRDRLKRTFTFTLRKAG